MLSDSQSSGLITVEASGWGRGVDSLANPWLLSNDQYRWGVNITCRGGLPQTRPGRAMRLTLPAGNLQGGCLFHATKKVKSGDDMVPLNNYYLILVVDGVIYAVPFDEEGDLSQPLDWRTVRLGAFQLDPDVNMAYLETPNRKATLADGVVQVVTPHDVLVIQDGKGGKVWWDGELAAQVREPSSSEGLTFAELPTGTWMAYSGDRLWVATPDGVKASDIGDPLNFTERLAGEGRGDFTFKGPVTGLADYHDSDENAVLVVFTATTRSVLQSGIRDRAQWGASFQRLLDPSCGCVAGRSIAFQAGLMWWFSSGGLVSANPATQRYHTDEVPYQDSAMARAKGQMSNDLSGVCSAAFERFLLTSVPVGEALNSQTMVLDLGARNDVDTAAWCGVWTGTRPVQWIVGEVRGVQRIFQLSVDYQSVNGGSHLNVWEEFQQEQNDVYFVVNPDDTLTYVRHRIFCHFETALMGPGMGMKYFRHAEFDISRLGGDVDMTVSYRSWRGATREVFRGAFRSLFFDYQLEGLAGEGEAVVPIGQLLPQSRRARTEEVGDDVGEKCCGSSLPGNVDRAFSLVFEWCGQAGVDALVMRLAPYPEQDVGMPDPSESESCAQGEAGVVTLELPDIGVEDQLDDSAPSWVSVKTATSTQPCPGQSAVPGLAVTIEVTYRSFISQEDANARAQEEAQSQADAEAARLRSQQPCAWDSLRYASRTCRSLLDGEALGVTLLSEADKFVIVGVFQHDVATAQGRMTAKSGAGGTRLLDFSQSSGFNNVARVATRVNASSPYEESVMVAGDFTTCGGVAASGLVRIFSDGSRDAAFITAVGTAFNGRVLDACPVSGTSNAYFVGLFTSFNGSTRRGGAYLSSGGAVSSFNPSYTADTVNSCRAIVVGGGHIYVIMDVASDAPNVRVVELNGAGARQGTFTDYIFADPGTTVKMHLRLDALGRVYVNTRAGIVRLLATGAVDSTFAAYTPPVGYEVTGLEVVNPLNQDPVTYVAISGASDADIIQLDDSGTQTAWSMGAAADGPINDLRFLRGWLVAVGDFTTLGGKTLSNFAMIAYDSGYVNPSAEFEVRSGSARSLTSQADADTNAQAIADAAALLALPCT